MRIFCIITILLTSALGLASQEETRKTSVTIEYTKLVYDFSGEQKRVILEGSVKITTNTMTITCDRADLLSSRSQEKTSPENPSAQSSAIPQDTTLGTIDYILATGNVDIQQMGTQALAGKAEIFPQERKLILEDNPRIIDQNGVVSGYRIVFLQDERQIRIEPGDSDQRNRIQLNDISEIDFLMGEKPPEQPSPATE